MAIGEQDIYESDRAHLAAMVAQGSLKDAGMPRPKPRRPAPEADVPTAADDAADATAPESDEGDGPA